MMKIEAAYSSVRAKFLLGPALAAALLLTPMVGCRSTDASPPTQQVLALTVARLRITVLSDRPASIESRGDQALVTFGRHRMRVEKGRVVLDDNETAAFPTTATQIVIEVARTTLRVTADGQEMWKKSFLSE